jgi:hypothetical protein
MPKKVRVPQKESTEVEEIKQQIINNIHAVGDKEYLIRQTTTEIATLFTKVDALRQSLAKARGEDGGSQNPK